VSDGGGWFAGPEHASFELGAETPRAGALLLHGFPGTPAELRPLGEALSSAGVRAQAPLLPGFGPAMEHLGDTGPREWLAAAAQAWKDIRKQNARTVLVGYSMGGALALRLAASHPPERLILVAPLWRLLGPAWPLGALLPIVQRLVPSFGLLDHGSALDNPELRQFFARAAPDLDLDRPEVRAELRRRVRLRTATVTQLWRLAIGSGSAASAVQAPTLILQGKTDPVVRARDTRDLARRFGGPVRLHELEAGHLLLDSTASGWTSIRELILSFAAP
jgi:carboxylesterase